MRNILITIIVIMLIGIVGCTKPAQLNSSDELLKPQRPVSEHAKMWIDKYGIGLESVEHYNITLIRQALNLQSMAIDDLEKRVKKLETNTGLSQETQ